jgi:hypothetical protein
MASSLRGTGFHTFGFRRLRPDGSYATTEFFCILYLPIIPIKTIRVTPAPGSSSLPFVRRKYRAVIKEPLDRSQVVSIYLQAAAWIGYGILFFESSVPFLRSRTNLIENGWIEFALFLGWMAVPWALLTWARSAARRRLQQGIHNVNTPHPFG